jgi:2-polyprenyl-3-methyl-5-hydroxy-6-metoxy-1,4-benzoquinol methylase
MSIGIQPAPLHCPCEGKYLATVFIYRAPPEGEIRFNFSSSGEYRREILRCALCGHFVSQHQMDDRAFYTGDYVNSNYSDESGIRRAFERINNLDPSKSDNVGRVRRVLEFVNQHFAARSDRAPSILDVGSGLCVFLHSMKAAGWDCTALDPDPRAVKHARETVGVKVVFSDFMAVSDLGRFDVVTFNKVLEHVDDPVSMLTKASAHLNPCGFVYVEVPDGEIAVKDGPGREEFFIDHRHVFSATSAMLMASRAGFAVRALERLREPSAKYTLRAFLARAE